MLWAQKSQLGEFIAEDTATLKSIGWQNLVNLKRGRPDLQIGPKFREHPAYHMLSVLKQRGAPVRLKSAPWSDDQIRDTIQRGPHKSAIQYAEFLRDELVAFIRKSQWVVLPLSVVLNDPELRRALHVSPMGNVLQRDRRPRVIVDYSFHGVNDDTI
jgi:hypothetical protein